VARRKNTSGDGGETTCPRVEENHGDHGVDDEKNRGVSVASRGSLRVPPGEGKEMGSFRGVIAGRRGRWRVVGDR
jgi:hypothetical protein